VRSIPPSAKKGHWLAWTLAGVWFAGVAFAFFRFDLEHRRPFESVRAARFDATSRTAAAERWFHANVPAPDAGPPPLVTVVHVYRSDCPCNRFTQQHLTRIVARYESRSVRFVVAEAATADSAHTHAQAAASTPSASLPRVPIPATADLEWIDATPAALVYDGAGRLIYYGPYSDSARCGEGRGLIEPVLERALHGEHQAPHAFLGGGCFCSTHTSI
jgi:hypothetical protein